MRVNDRTKRSLAGSAAVLDALAAQVGCESEMRCIDDATFHELRHAEETLRRAAERLFARSQRGASIESDVP